ncbi:MAG TPA: hypothetical protein VN372_09485 [Methanospirillum sp.]|nr:hypothetical protein [Methanospirillum sp.]
MVIEIVSYNTSILNPFLKMLIPVGFCIAAWLFYRCRQNLGGILRRVSTLLLLGAFAAIIASLFRFEGDFYTQYKWGESILNLILVLLTLIIALVVRKKMNEASSIFVSEDEGI